jgi:hypothetical protein
MTNTYSQIQNIFAIKSREQLIKEKKQEKLQKYLVLL